MLVSWALWVSGMLWSGPNELAIVDNVKSLIINLSGRAIYDICSEMFKEMKLFFLSGCLTSNKMAKILMQRSFMEALQSTLL